MKMVRLLLQAFGPFTNQEIVFSEDEGRAAPNLHLIHGPNEAGKSSALRAMTDLRFGIPQQSSDNFEHDYRNMRIAGVFVDGTGRQIGLSRRKGRGATLTAFDPQGGETIDLVEGVAHYEFMLTGGLQRSEFEAMYGLTHWRLREGGELLLRGEGELGAALFEASAGTGSVSELLSALESDAKVLFNPHGRAQAAKINEARKEIEAQRRVLRQALMRPNEWAALSRAYQQARDARSAVDGQLEDLRRRHLEVTELRSVLPLVREHDRLQADLGRLGDVPNLVDNARDNRLGAQQSLLEAARAEAQAEREAENCDQSLAGLVINTNVLRHEGSIERLHAVIDQMLKAQAVVAQEQGKVENLRASLAAEAKRIAPAENLEALLDCLPSQADRTALEVALSELEVQRARLQEYREQAAELDAAERELASEPGTMPAEGVKHRLIDALENAKTHRDRSARIAEISREIDTLSVDLDQKLVDIGAGGIAELRCARPILATQVEQVERRLSELDDEQGALKNELRLVTSELEKLRSRRRQLAAEGEVVTAETLKDAREKRDSGWRFVRRAYVDQTDPPEQLAKQLGVERSLADGFEGLQAEADRQADILRAESKRAASFEACVASISEQSSRADRIETRLADTADARHQIERDWRETLAAAGIPELAPAAAREWLRQRERVIELAAALDRASKQRSGLIENLERAYEELAEALTKAGECLDEDSLDSMVRRASAWLQNATTVEVTEAENAKARMRMQSKRESLRIKTAEAEDAIDRHEQRLQAWQPRLFLSAGVSADVFRARLNELDALYRHAVELQDARGRLESSRSIIVAFESQASLLANLLGEASPLSAQDFADRAMRELREARALEEGRRDLERRKGDALRRKQESARVRQMQERILDGLRQAAGVSNDADLAVVEAAFARKRDLLTAVDKQKTQLAEASSRGLEQLRTQLEGRDLPGLDAERERCELEIARLSDKQQSARQAEDEARRKLELVDASDAAAKAREAMESAIARFRSAARPWARLKLAHALLEEALRRFREKAQAPMVRAASDYFALISGGRYPQLLADEEGDRQVLVAERADRVRIGIDAMSDGTADQLYLALRLAALELQRRAQRDMPLVLDDVLITSDEGRVANILNALAKFAEGGQVLLFTHQRHLADLARNALSDRQVKIHELVA